LPFASIAIVGAGAWGAALANAIARAGRAVTIYARDAATAETMRRTRESVRLPGVPLDDRITVAELSDDASSKDALLLAIPSQQLRAVATLIGPKLAIGTPVVACAKGIERGSRRFMAEVIAESMTAALPAILSGPSFAADVARGLPTAVTLAVPDKQVATALAHALGSATFRPYHTTDVRGVEIGGAAKNVYAIAAGIVAGRGLGASAAAALTTRGFAELVRFGIAFGAKPDTMIGLSGLGDLILTCSTPQSRNFSLGLALGEGRSPDEARTGTGLAEGAFTASVLVEAAGEKRIEMPIAAAVAAILDGRITVDEAIDRLLTRPFRAEG
jgi:glycerol-3-phosphate dehydrogenase (NAD(P)+)